MSRTLLGPILAVPISQCPDQRPHRVSATSNLSPSIQFQHGARAAPHGSWVWTGTVRGVELSSWEGQRHVKGQHLWAPACPPVCLIQWARVQSTVPPVLIPYRSSCLLDLRLCRAKSTTCLDSGPTSTVWHVQNLCAWLSPRDMPGVGSARGYLSSGHLVLPGWGSCRVFRGPKCRCLYMRS